MWQRWFTRKCPYGPCARCANTGWVPVSPAFAHFDWVCDDACFVCPRCGVFEAFHPYAGCSITVAEWRAHVAAVKHAARIGWALSTGHRG